MTKHLPTSPPDDSRRRIVRTMKRISSALLFNSAQVAVFDDGGEQVIELQRPLLAAWAEKATALGYDVDGLTFQTQAGARLTLTKYDTEEDGVVWISRVTG